MACACAATAFSSLDAWPSWSFNQLHLVLGRHFFRSLEGIVSRVVRAFDVEVIVIFKNNQPTGPGRPAGCRGRARTNSYVLNSLIIGFLVCSARHYVFLLCKTCSLVQLSFALFLYSIIFEAEQKERDDRVIIHASRARHSAEIVLH